MPLRRVASTTIVSVTLLAAMIFAMPASAQRQVRFGIAPSVAFPVGSLGDLVNSGPGGMLMITAGSNTSYFGFRFDISEHRLRGRDHNGVRQESINMTAASANIVATLPLFRYVKPYGMLGGGIYPFRKTSDDRSYDFGINFGTGLTFPLAGATGFTEIRYHRIYGRTTSQRYIPLSFGMMF